MLKRELDKLGLVADDKQLLPILNRLMYGVLWTGGTGYAPRMGAELLPFQFDFSSRLLPLGAATNIWEAFCLYDGLSFLQSREYRCLEKRVVGCRVDAVFALLKNPLSGSRKHYAVRCWSMSGSGSVGQHFLR